MFKYDIDIDETVCYNFTITIVQIIISSHIIQLMYINRGP